MKGFAVRPIFPAVLVLVSACAGASLPTLPPPPQGLPKADAVDSSHAPLETSVIASGSPTSVYALVAQGALGCWFGAQGRLKATHVFQAEAEPPAQGGMAEIVLHERDETLRDKRGTRAVRIGFSGVPNGTQVRVAMIKMEPQLAPLMTKDVGVWASGGSGCHTGKLAPPQPPAPVATKGKAASPASKKH